MCLQPLGKLALRFKVDILFWDPMLPHAAPVTRGLKTIISFNLNYEK
jgi:hypothetical protein